MEIASIKLIVLALPLAHVPKIQTRAIRTWAVRGASWYACMHACMAIVCISYTYLSPNPWVLEHVGVGPRDLTSSSWLVLRQWTTIAAMWKDSDHALTNCLTQMLVWSFESVWMSPSLETPMLQIKRWHTMRAPNMPQMTCSQRGVDRPRTYSFGPRHRCLQRGSVAEPNA